MKSNILTFPSSTVLPVDVDDMTQLIGHCLDDDEQAYTLIYDRYATEIYRLCYNLLQHREDAEEVMQDAFEYAFRRLSTYKPEKSAFRTWLYRIAISRCRNKRRRKWLPAFSLNLLSPDTVTDHETPTPAEVIQLTQEQKIVWEALGQLSSKLRETAVLRYYNGLSYKEIGVILDISPKTVESRMRLAHKSLKNQLQEKI